MTKNDWVDVNKEQPSKNGLYQVMRNWSDERKAFGSCEFENGEWLDDVEDACGEIIKWKSFF